VVITLPLPHEPCGRGISLRSRVLLAQSGGDLIAGAAHTSNQLVALNGSAPWDRSSSRSAAQRGFSPPSTGKPSWPSMGKRPVGTTGKESASAIREGAADMEASGADHPRISCCVRTTRRGPRTIRMEARADIVEREQPECGAGSRIVARSCRHSVKVGGCIKPKAEQVFSEG
jgi:hypothetical protein